MSALVFTLKDAPAQRVDLSALLPTRLKGLALKEIAQTEIHTTREILRIGDLFHIRKGNSASIRIEGGSDRFDQVGLALDAGEIIVEGDVGARAGRLMRGGHLLIRGGTGPWAGSGLCGGDMEIAGNAGDFLGGPLAGEMAGMRGGCIRVRGSVGARAGDRQRRGTILVDGDAGAYAGSRMIAGTLVVAGKAGALPGYLMRRGTLVLGRKPDHLAPTFVDCGMADRVILRLMDDALATSGAQAGRLFQRRFRRLAGDTAVLGKGEILVRA